MLLTESALGRAVRVSAHRHLREFGLKDIRKEYGGVQYAVELQHCRISFWLYKNDLGSAIRPLSDDETVRYAAKQVDERSLSEVHNFLHGAEVSEVERQTKLILENYRDILMGNIEGWPLETS